MPTMGLPVSPSHDLRPWSTYAGKSDSRRSVAQAPMNHSQHQGSLNFDDTRFQSFMPKICKFCTTGQDQTQSEDERASQLHEDICINLTTTAKSCLDHSPGLQVEPPAPAIGLLFKKRCSAISPHRQARREADHNKAWQHG